MNRSHQRREGMSALELIEQAVHLLRRAPMSVLAGYYVGAVPFVLGLLYFWADMSRNAFASRRCAEEALGLALLFFWMKCWQAVFASELKARVAGAEPSRWTRGRVARLAAAQVILQSSAPFLLPLALLMALPFGWASAFYHNAAVFGDGADAEVRPVLRRAMQQARLWPRQNHVLILVVWLFGFFVMLNLATAMLLAPELLRILAGVETVFTLSGTHMLNTTFLAALFGLTYLAVNPLMKACYVLRCFYGESVQSGADLKAQLRALLAAGAVLVIGLLFAAPDALGARASRPSLLVKPQLPWAADRPAPVGATSATAKAKLREGKLNRTPAQLCNSILTQQSAPPGSKGGSQAASQPLPQHAAKDTAFRVTGPVWGCAAAGIGMKTSRLPVGREKNWNCTPAQVCNLAFAQQLTPPKNFRRSFAASRRLWPPVSANAASVRSTPSSRAASADGQAALPAVSPAALDDAIKEVLSRPEYAWRMPREQVEEENGLLASLLDDFLGVLRRGLRNVSQWIRDALEWLDEYLRRHQPREREGGFLGLDWMETAQWLLVLLACAAVVALTLMLLRAWRRHRRAETVAAEAIASMPDVSDETITADQLPADEWLQRARELMERGELRLALRALYLGSLATLAQQEMIVLARCKSNHDYERELGRRAHARPQTVNAFTQNVVVFDRVWYGAHPVDDETMGRFTANIERIQARA